MRPTVCLMILTLCASACATATPTSLEAVCDASRAARADHAAALAEAGSDLVVVTGARLIAVIDAGCE